jgi:glycosyltransferase involved in cell wall biosynthesis
MKSAIVIIPTTGANTLIQAVESISKQTYKDVTALIVVDGKEFASKVRKMFFGRGFGIPIQIVYLEENVGAGGFYGQRVYAAFSHLVNKDYLFFLDQDNWYAPTHIESMISTIELSGSQWAYSLRNIYSPNGEYLLQDNCESLGKWSAWTNTNMVDTNCYCIPKEIAIKIASFWHSGWGEDRVIFNVLHNNFNNYECSGKYTINYRLGGNEGSVTKEFFEHGNKIINETYKGKYPWAK